MAREMRASGEFQIGGQMLQGDLVVQASESSLHVVSRTRFSPNDLNDRTILGTLRDLSRVSLLQGNAPPIASQRWNGHEQRFYADIFAHFVLTGEVHLRAKDAAVTAIHLVTDDAATIFYDFDAFGFALDPSPLIAAVTASNAAIVGRPIAVGRSPSLAYFSGRTEIFAVDTVIGSVSARHNVKTTMGGPDGVVIGNAISFDLIFHEPVVFDQAIDRVLATLIFLHMMAGRMQNIVTLTVDVRVDGRDQPLQAHWSLPPSRRVDGDGKPNPSEVPIMAALEPEVFGAVLARWLERDPSWREARSRFSGWFGHANVYGTDRLVAAANVFDILPESAVPETVGLSTDLRDAKAKAKALFLGLPKTSERESVLNALGRLGDPVLRDKVLHRAAWVKSAFPGGFGGLDAVIGLAVDCRNHYVHGSRPKIDYTEYFHDSVPFLTDTLDFIFAMSDLLEAGWDPTGWAARGTSMGHPLATYRATYPQRYAALLAIPRAKAPRTPAT